MKSLTIIIFIACIIGLIASGYLLFFKNKSEGTLAPLWHIKYGPRVDYTEFGFTVGKEVILSFKINDEGKLEVEGDMTGGAKFFFEHHLKPLVWSYIHINIRKELIRLKEQIENENRRIHP